MQEPIANLARLLAFTGEAHRLFVGETGLGRVIRRALEVMAEKNSGDPKAVSAAGAIDLPLMQEYIDLWYSSALDLFGSDQSTNAANYFANGLKCRPDEDQFENRIAKKARYELEEALEDGNVKKVDVPLRNAKNAVARRARRRKLRGR